MRRSASIPPGPHGAPAGPPAEPSRAAHLPRPAPFRRGAPLPAAAPAATGASPRVRPWPPPGRCSTEPRLPLAVTAAASLLLVLPSWTAAAAAPPEEPLTWEGLESRLEREAARGFSGSVLVAREGEIVLDRGYGLANPGKEIPCRADTIYAIGSTPIDFTRAGILLLAQEGKLALDDSITRFIDSVPADKQAITIEHLMSGRSGLKDFLGRPSDPNPDHFYIDRGEALRRIFEDDLLFEPGTGRRHSHAAWGVLAAVIEMVSGESYPEFTRRHLLGPAGMKDTGFFGEPYPEERMAIGRSEHTSGAINAPPYWGPASWLVMGSGGMVSTTRDMYRWHLALAEGKILDEEHLEKYWSPAGSLLAGGDMFGFEVVYTQGPETLMILMSNAGGRGGVERIQSLGRDLASLVSTGRPQAGSRKAPAYSLGVQLGIEADQSGTRVMVEAVAPGSAAARDGLEPGDRILSANGTALGEDPLAVLDPFLQTGGTIRFEIERDGARRTVDVIPSPRAGP